MTYINIYKVVLRVMVEGNLLMHFKNFTTKKNVQLQVLIGVYFSARYVLITASE